MAGILMTDPGFGRGQTLGVKDAAQGGSVTGTQKTFLDADPRTSNSGKHLSNRAVTCIAVRNTSGSAILPGTVVKLKATALLEEVDGVAPTGGIMCGVADEYLPSSGCANLDVFWLVVSGPTSIATQEALAAGDVLTATAGEAAAGDPLKPNEYIGYALAAPAGGKVRAVVGVNSEHSI